MIDQNQDTHQPDGIRSCERRVARGAAFSHTLRCLSLYIDKRIRVNEECDLLMGVQLADENHDQRGRADSPGAVDLTRQVWEQI